LSPLYRDGPLSPPALPGLPMASYAAGPDPWMDPTRVQHWEKAVPTIFQEADALLAVSC